jgi:hypothetical protein
MASDLQRVAQALVECLDQIPDMVSYLQRLAVRCRESHRPGSIAQPERRAGITLIV